MSGIVQDGIDKAFADLEPGAFLTVAQIAKRGNISPTAVAARLFAKGVMTVTGVEPVVGPVRGAIKK